MHYKFTLLPVILTYFRNCPSNSFVLKLHNEIIIMCTVASNLFKSCQSLKTALALNLFKLKSSCANFIFNDNKNYINYFNSKLQTKILSLQMIVQPTYVRMERPVMMASTPLPALVTRVIMDNTASFNRLVSIRMLLVGYSRWFIPPTLTFFEGSFVFLPHVFFNFSY